MSIKELCKKELNINLINNLSFINKCQHCKNDYFLKSTKNRHNSWYYKKYNKHCLSSLDFIDKQKINSETWILNLQCEDNHQVIKKLIFNKNNWKIINIKN